jgi:hypothetical protein
MLRAPRLRLPHDFSHLGISDFGATTGAGVKGKTNRNEPLAVGPDSVSAVWTLAVFQHRAQFETKWAAAVFTHQSKLLLNAPTD